jgi:hypothetical protein
LVSPEDLAAIVRKLEVHAETGETAVRIRMGFDEWTVYWELLLHTSSKIPQRDPKDYETLDELLGKYGQMHRDGLTPAGPERA